MHRHDALRRQIEVQRGEHRLLHLARVGRAADQHDLAGEIDRHHGVGAFAAAVTLGVRLERRHVDDGHVRHEARKLGAIRTDQELADEQRVPGVFGEDARLDPVLRIGAAVEVLREQRLALRMRQEVLVAWSRTAPCSACGCRPTRRCSRSAHRRRCACPSASGRCDGRSRRRARRRRRSWPRRCGSRARRAGLRSDSSGPQPRSFKPNVSAPQAALRRPDSFTETPPHASGRLTGRTPLDRPFERPLDGYSPSARMGATFSRDRSACQDHSSACTARSHALISIKPGNARFSAVTLPAAAMAALRFTHIASTRLDPPSVRQPLADQPFLDDLGDLHVVLVLHHHVARCP